jgi:hypothetical protein
LTLRGCARKHGDKKTARQFVNNTDGTCLISAHLFRGGNLLRMSFVSPLQ